MLIKPIIVVVNGILQMLNNMIRHSFAEDHPIAKHLYMLHIVNINCFSVSPFVSVHTSLSIFWDARIRSMAAFSAAVLSIATADRMRPFWNTTI
jgi:hypothetical protein